MASSVSHPSPPLLRVEGLACRRGERLLFSGLGLSLVAKIAADHRGVVSYLPGEPGAVFRVRLPAARQQALPVPQREVA